MRTTFRRVSLVTPLIVLGVALNGCGVADEQLKPGVAADVDGTEITQSSLDDTVAGTCAYLDSADASANVARFPRVTVRRLLVQTLVQQVAAERLLDELDLGEPDNYATAVASIDQDYADSPADQQDAMRTGDKASSFVGLASDEIGNALLRDETGSEPGDPEQIRTRGTQAIADWLADHSVDLNPTYGLTVDDGTFTADDGLSVPTSAEAVDALGIADIDLMDTESDLATLINDATATLPEDQVCGPAA